LRANRDELAAIRLRQCIMIDVSSQSLSTSVVGKEVSMPIVFHGNREIHGARVAQALGIPFCLSTMSICSIEDVRAAWRSWHLRRPRSPSGP
jgi:L-lactate dehydrogenase (cytochrome)